MGVSKESITMNEVERSYGIRKLESRLRPSGKSIIEQWQNTTNRRDGILQNDEYYEERAVDVGNEPIRSIESRESLIREETTKNTTRESRKKNSRKNSGNIGGNGWAKCENDQVINRNESMGTVRSIPIRDYRASMAYDMGTLRGSITPQRHYDTFISESERNSRDFIKRQGRKIATISSSVKNRHPRVSIRSTGNNVSIDKSCQSNAPESRRKSRGSLKSKRSRTRNGGMEFSPNYRFINDDFSMRMNLQKSGRGSSRKGERSCPRSFDVKNHGNFDNSGVERSRDEADYESERENTVDLERGNVGKKISVYEGNVRSSTKSTRDKPLRGDFENFNNVNRHRNIGVPLVGMHNACGLPVVGAWPKNNFIGTLRVLGKSVDNIRRVDENSALTARSRTRSKRKAPQSEMKSHELSIRETTSRSKENGGSTVGERNDESTGSMRIKRILKRPSFKADKLNSMPYKQRYNRRNTVGKASNKDPRVNATSLGKRSIGKRSLKRSTLYAKDEGNEAAEVLTGLCLNPLARNKNAANMMW